MSTDNLNNDIPAEEEEDNEEEEEEDERNLEGNSEEEQHEEREHIVPSLTVDQRLLDHHSNHTSFTTPVLLNLAQAALERLGAQVGDTSILDDDFQPIRKKRKTHSEQTTSTSNNNGNNKDGEEVTDENEGQICSVCLEPWSNSGGHRIASLKCGHLFGYNCIEKWLKGQGERCPQCNAKAKKGDIRVIYSKSISAIDTTERDRALKELEEEKQARITAQKSEAQAILQYQLAKAECDRVREELRHCRQELEAYTKENDGTIPKTVSVTKSEGSFVPFKVIPVSPVGGGRVLCHDDDVMVISRPSSNRLFPGWGLTKISLMDLKSKEFVPVHDKCIRDVKFSPRGDGMLLTTGLDKTLQLTSLHSNVVVQKYTLPVPGWSCCWNNDDPNYLFSGLVNGLMLMFDIRRTDSFINEFKVSDTNSSSCSTPITSLTHIPLCSSSTFNCSGVLSGTLDGGLFWEKSDGQSYKPHLLDNLSGSCTGVSFEPVTRHCMASFRPSKRVPFSRHLVCQLRNTPITDPFSCQVIHQFNGGTVHRLLSRSLLFQKPTTVGQLLVAYSNEAKNLTCICDVNSGSMTQELSTEGQPCLDITTLDNNRHSFLTLLTEHKLYLYQWQQ